MAVAMLCALVAVPASANAADAPSRATFSTVTREVLIPMEDGVRLAATIGFPSTDGQSPAPGPFPAILEFTPYSKDLSAPSSYFTSRGYVYAVVDIRGAGASEGNLNDNYFSPREQRDGRNLVEYLGTQPWSNGRVGMYGGSYQGIVQYLTAAQRPPHLKAIVPQVALADLYRDATYHGGILSQFFGAQYLAVQGGPGLLSGLQEPNNREAALGAKLQQAQSDPIAFDYLANTTDTTFYRERSPAAKAHLIEVPALIRGGWFDGFVRGPSEMFPKLAEREGVETRLWMDPVPHKGARSQQYNPDGYPASALDSFSAAALEFFDRHLKLKDMPVRPPVKLFLMGRDRYIEDSQWPPAEVDHQRLYLRPGGLSGKRPEKGSETFFTNPSDGFTTTLSRHGNVAASPYSPRDQSEERERGLVWETDALEDPLAVVGPMALKIVASSTAPDTDWIVRVSDVAPDGSAKLLTEGYLRASHRELDKKRSRPDRPFHTHTDPEPIRPGERIPYEIEVWPTAQELAAGHRLRVQLTSNDTPNHTPGTVTADRDDPSKVEVRPHLPAMNTVFYGDKKGSALVLPVLGSG
jgi:uncharacterized protein